MSNGCATGVADLREDLSPARIGQCCNDNHMDCQQHFLQMTAIRHTKIVSFHLEQGLEWSKDGRGLLQTYRPG